MPREIDPYKHTLNRARGNIIKALASCRHEDDAIHPDTLRIAVEHLASAIYEIRLLIVRLDDKPHLTTSKETTPCPPLNPQTINQSTESTTATST